MKKGYLSVIAVTVLCLCIAVGHFISTDCLAAADNPVEIRGDVAVGKTVTVIGKCEFIANVQFPDEGDYVLYRITATGRTATIFYKVEDEQAAKSVSSSIKSMETDGTIAFARGTVTYVRYEQDFVLSAESWGGIGSPAGAED